MHISLPEGVKCWVEAQVKAGGYGTASEYFRQLLREEQKRQAIDRKLEAALDSGPAVPVPEEEWEARKRRVTARLAERRTRTGRARNP
jgi:antitoxin ParD1/3/4